MLTSIGIQPTQENDVDGIEPPTQSPVILTYLNYTSYRFLGLAYNTVIIMYTLTTCISTSCGYNNYFPTSKVFRERSHIDPNDSNGLEPNDRTALTRNRT